jgi:hypothetical protein
MFVDAARLVFRRNRRHDLATESMALTAVVRGRDWIGRD